ncbi:hypothetical protein OF83DRAFT_1084527 [Amylostereum chailletii]|nr:hypothetical protein OF83DRAFT_1084527 [Amylostereum chailletii]
MAAVLPMPSNLTPVFDVPATYPTIHNVEDTSPPNGNKSDAEAALEFDYASIFTDDLNQLSREGKISHTFAATVHISNAVHLYTHLKLSTPTSITLHGTGSAWSTSFVASDTYDGRVDILEYDALPGSGETECKFVISGEEGGVVVVRFTLEGRVVAMFTGRGRSLCKEAKGEKGEGRIEGEFRWSWPKAVE